MVVTDYHLGEILHNRDSTGRISKWTAELGALRIRFTPRKTIKSQALADFVAEWTEMQSAALETTPEHWKIYFDGSLKLGGVGGRVLFIPPSGEQIKYVLQILWQPTNNEAEYETLLHVLHLAVSLRIKRLLVYRDSSMVVNLINKDRDCTKETMDAYCAEVRKLEKHFIGLELHYIP